MNKIGFISNKGVKPILILIGLTIIGSLVSDFFGYLFLLLTLFSIYIFRDTKRYIYENSDSILSPIDGKVIAIDKIDDKLKIYCKVSLCDNHIVRAPFTSEMKIKKYNKGLNLNPNTLKANSLNEQITYKFSSEDKETNLKLKLVSGFFNIGIDKIQNAKLSQGDEILFFIDGIAIITIKEECNLLVNIGDKISSGQSVLYKK